ncbi:MAG: VWA domain-containing protein [Chloroflexi bacterium]|nr:VWA domain-containing protein [Chloroflexota bacterium]
MDPSRNLYAILGIPPEATQQDIREAYRIAARRFHPDANGNEGADLQFRDIAAAYELLGDPINRAEYDLARRDFADEPNFYSLRVTPSKRVLTTLEEPQVVYLLLEVIPATQASVNDRPDTRMNLTLVLDRSNSMRGIRLEKVKIAAHQIIDQMAAGDVLSVISFSDRADVMIPAEPIQDKQSLRSIISMMRAGGGTEIFHGLAAGMKEAERYLNSKYVNHVILLTDGRTFGDENQCLMLAEDASELGIGISAMGIGEEWNDDFLDALASRTGGYSAYINSPSSVVRFLNERVRSLGASFTERLQLTIAPDADVELESVFKLSPTPQPADVSPQPIPLGSLEFGRPVSALIQLQMPPSSKTGFRTVARLDVTGDVLMAEREGYKVLSDISVEIARNPAPEEPPLAILDALGKLTLYRMQQKAEQSVAQGNIVEATRRLENLATRLLAVGQEDLAQRAAMEARRVSKTNMLSEEGRKTLKFGTRMLLALPKPSGEGDQ